MSGKKILKLCEIWPCARLKGKDLTFKLKSIKVFANHLIFHQKIMKSLKERAPF